MKSTNVTLGFVLTLALALLLSFAFAGPTAFAADGNLDPSFSGDGLAMTDFQNTYDYANDIAIQPDGKIVAAGTTEIDGLSLFAVARYTPEGLLDPGFHSGYVLTSFGSGFAGASAIAIQPDGKIIAAGYCFKNATYSTAMVRYHPNGALDTSFGGNGTVCGAWPGILTGIALLPDGKIIASGYTPFAQGDSFSVFRFYPEGAPDTLFGNQGRVTTTFFGLQSRANDVVLQPDGKILVAGTAQRSGADNDFALARYLPGGFLDTSFNGSGIVTTNLAGGSDEANAIALAPDGKIYVAGGFFSTTQNSNFGLARYLSNGSLDTSFSGDGIVDVPIFAGADSDVAFDVLVQPADGKVVAAGQANNSTGSSAALVRLNTNGALDTTFGTGGKITNNFNGSNSAAAYGLAIQSDGKLISGGSAFMGTTNKNDFAMARYLSTLPPTATPTATRTSTPTVPPTATPTACPIEFTDVPQGSTYYDFVHCLACRGIIGGYTAGCPTGNPCFKPDNSLIRADLAKIVSNASGFAETYNTNTFQDVPVGSLYFQFVERLASRSIMSGFSCGGVGEPCFAPGNRPYFRPNTSASRSEFAKVVATALNLSAPSPILRSFEDVPTNHPFWRWIEALHRSRFIGGFACGSAGEPCVAPNNRPYFRPNAIITRGDASVTITFAYFPACMQRTLPRK